MPHIAHDMPCNLLRCFPPHDRPLHHSLFLLPDVVVCVCPFFQVIYLLKDAFDKAGLTLYLRPYGCLPTGYECGIIEVVPATKSRAALGELSDRGLYDIFSAEFGAPGSPAFERARHNFIVSEAAYAVASFLLQVRRMWQM